MLPVIVPQTPVVVPTVSSAPVATPVAVPVEAQPSVALVEPVPVQTAGPGDIILANVAVYGISADSNSLAIPPESVLENHEGPTTHKVINPGVVLGIRNSGSYYFTSLYNGRNTVFQIVN